MVDARRPVHLAVIAGVTVGTYAVSLACVTGWQFAADCEIVAARAPGVAAADALSQSHDGLQARIDAASRAYVTGADTYAQLAPRLEAAEVALDRLAAAVGRVTGVAGSLPTHISLPKVSTKTPVAKKPPVQASTGASG